MKSKISVNIDTELLDIVRECSDSDLDSIVQDALAQFLGVRQIWVKSDNLEPVSKITVLAKTTKANSSVKKHDARMKKEPRYILKIWDKLKGELKQEFTVDDYWEATKICGLGYKDSAKTNTILRQLKVIEEEGSITQIGDNPKRYKKAEIGEEGKRAEESKEPQKESKESQKESQKEPQKEPEERLGELIDHSIDVQERERKVEKEILA